MLQRQPALAAIACAAVFTLGVCAAVHGAESPWTVVHEPQLRKQFHGSYQLAFVDADDGWVVGPTNYGTPVSASFAGYKTADGGRTWSEIDIPFFRVWLLPGDPAFVEGRPQTYPGAKPYSVHRLGRREAWIGGGERIAHTTNGGETWELLNIDVAAIDSVAAQRMADGGQLNVYGVYFWTSMDGYAWCVAQEHGEGDALGYALLVTSDGGRSWTARATSTAGVSGVFGGWRFTMTSPSTGWVTSAVLLPNGLWRTSDGWRTLSQSIGRPGVSAAHFASDGRAWAITALFQADGSRFPIGHSVDGGVTWRTGVFDGTYPDALVGSNTLMGLTFDAEGRGWATGDDGQILTTRDGVLWRAEESPTTVRLMNAVSVGGVVYAVGDDGTILKRTPSATAVHPSADTRPIAWGRLRRGGAE